MTSTKRPWRLFQSSPVRIGRALTIAIQKKINFGPVSILARPHWTGARSGCLSAVPASEVSILARPHWTGAHRVRFAQGVFRLFQSSPVRIGRALADIKNTIGGIKVSILARPHWTGALTL